MARIIQESKICVFCVVCLFCAYIALDGQVNTQSVHKLFKARLYFTDDITADGCRGWTRHFKRLFPRCITREDIHCVVDEKGTSGVARLHCTSYSSACTVFPKVIVMFTFFLLLFFSLCYTVLSFPFCIAMTWPLNKLQYKQ